MGTRRKTTVIVLAVVAFTLFFAFIALAHTTTALVRASPIHNLAGYIARE